MSKYQCVFQIFVLPSDLFIFCGSGFENEDGSCCGIANVELGPLCSSFTLKVCANTSEYVFWDSYHPTERAYEILVKQVLDNKIDEFL